MLDTPWNAWRPNTEQTGYRRLTAHPIRPKSTLLRLAKIRLQECVSCRLSRSCVMIRSSLSWSRP